MYFKLDVRPQLPSKVEYFQASTKRGFKAGVTRALNSIVLGTLANVNRSDANIYALGCYMDCITPEPHTVLVQQEGQLTKIGEAIFNKLR